MNRIIRMNVLLPTLQRRGRLGWYSAFSALPSASSGVTNHGLLDKLRLQNEKDIINLPEYKARTNLSNFLSGRVSSSHLPNPITPPTPPSFGYTHVLTPSQMLLTLDAAIATFHLHV